MKLLAFPPLADDRGRARLEEAAGPSLQVVCAADEAEAAREIVDADAFFGRLTPDLLRAATRLRWVQAPTAGLEHYVFPELAARDDVTLTNMRGVYNDHIADHAFGFVLAFARGLHVAFRRQFRGEWDPGNVPIVHLADATLGVVGLGGIGAEVARRGKTSGMRVVAVDPRRSDRPGFVDELSGPDRLDALLAESDFVVLCTPHTPETEKMIRAPQLARMKPSAFLVNIGRGVTVDLADLTRALQNGQVAGAGLDVFETEPLPPGHPLWSMENVLFTPHTAGNSPHADERRFGVLLENAGRFARGETLTNVVDKVRRF